MQHPDQCYVYWESNTKTSNNRTSFPIYGFPCKYSKLSWSSAKKGVCAHASKSHKWDKIQWQKYCYFWFPALHFLAEHALVLKLQVFAVSLLSNLDWPEKIKHVCFSFSSPSNDHLKQCFISNYLQNLIQILPYFDIHDKNCMVLHLEIGSHFSIIFSNWK